MTEASLVARAKMPITVHGLEHDFTQLGLARGDNVLVHSSLSSLGWVNGGAVAVVQALLRAIGEEGTIMMPSHSWNLSDPEKWMNPPVPDSWVQTIRETMPAYDPLITPTRSMGKVAETFRSWPGTLRSAHPSSSFAARGPNTAQLIANHQLDDPLGQTSPLGKLYRLDGSKILLIGVGFDVCTALHYAESQRWPDRPKMKEGAPLLVDGERKWVDFEVPQELNSDTFISIGESVLRIGLAKNGKLGEGRGTIVEMKALVDYAVSVWPEAFPR